MGFVDLQEYLSTLPPASRAVLEQVRRTLLSTVPGGEDGISYQMPAVKVAGRTVVHYAAWKDHVSLYPVPDGDEALREDMAPFVAGKGTLHFPLDRPVPTDLLSRIATALVHQRT